MIRLHFVFGTETNLIKIDRKNVTFGEGTADISNLKLNYFGVIKEFPDLKNNDNWRIEAIKRFRQKIKSFETEDEIANYIIKDLGKFGWKLKVRQKDGFRSVGVM